MDNIARVYRYPVQTNIDMILDLMEEGYLERLLKMCIRDRQRRGGHGDYTQRDTI